MPATANPLRRARAGLASSHVPPVQSSGLQTPARAARLRVGVYRNSDSSDYLTARPEVSGSVAGGARRRTRPRGSDRPAERVADLGDRSAARFKADEPEGEIEKTRDQRVECGRRLDVVGRAGDQRQPGRADELAEIADTVDKTHAAAPEPPRPQLAHIGADDRVVAATEKALQ